MPRPFLGTRRSKSSAPGTSAAGVVRTPATGSSAGGGTAGWTVKEIPLQRDPAPDGNPRPILQHQNTSRLVQLPRFPGRRHIGAALFSRTWRTLLFPNLRQSFLRAYITWSKTRCPGSHDSSPAGDSNSTRGGGRRSCRVQQCRHRLHPTSRAWPRCPYRSRMKGNG